VTAGPLRVVWSAGGSVADRDGVARPWLVHRAGSGGWDLYYAGLADGVWRICRAVADDDEPVAFRGSGPTLEPGPAGSGEELGVTAPCALLAPAPAGALAGADGVLLVYAGWSGDPPRPSVCSALLAGQPGLGPGAWWDRLGLLVGPGPAGAVDAGGCDEPCLVRVGGLRMLLYTAWDRPPDQPGARARVATASTRAGAPFTRHGVLLGGESGPDAAGARAAAARVGHGGLDIRYRGSDHAGRDRLLRARSADGRVAERLGVAEVRDLDSGAVVDGGDGRRWLVGARGSELVVAPVA
jgi:hypothetical protein